MTLNIRQAVPTPSIRRKGIGKLITWSDMTTLEWFLIGVVAVLVIILLAIVILVIVGVHRFDKALKKVQF